VLRRATGLRSIFALLLAKIFAQKALDGQKNDIKLPLNLPSGVKNFSI
jgi:hypothetical protein